MMNFPSLTNFLFDRKAKNSKTPFTHTRIGDKELNIYAGSYSIPDEELKSFYESYYQEVFNCNRNEYLTERQLDEAGCMAVDFDFRYDHSVDTRQHTKEHISDMVCDYGIAIKEFYKIKEDDAFNIYIFEKPNVNRLEDGSLTKDGIHMIIGLKVDYEIQLQIRDQMMDTLKDTWKDLPLTNDFDSVLDKGLSTGKTNWQLFGSKKPNNEAYCLTHIYSLRMETDDGDFITDEENVDTFDLEENFEKLSVRYRNNPKFELKKQKQKEPVVQDEDSDNETVIISSNNTEQSKNTATLNKIKDAYSLKRISGCGDFIHGSWKRLTLAIANSCGNEGKAIWDYISRKDMTNFNDAHNNKIWEECLNMKNKKTKELGFASLMSWAREDNLELYNTIFKSKIDWFRLTHYTFALELEKRFLTNNKSKIVFTGSKKQNTAYLFNGVYWKELSLNNSEIKKSHFTAMYDKYMKAFLKVENHYDTNTALGIKIAIKQLDNVRFRNDVIEALETERYVSDIKWNSYEYSNLFVFEDCIWDLNKGCFVEPNPDNYISMTCGYKFGNVKKDYTAEKDEFMKYIKNVFEDEMLVHYVLKMLASFLTAGNVEETAYFWLGDGRNSKGTLTRLLENIWGNYFGELKIGYYTNYDKGEDSPNNNLYNIRNARICNTSEIGEDISDNTKPQQFLTSKFKTASGGDNITARQPHEKNQVTFRMGHTIVQTNLMPNIAGIEQPKNISLQMRPRIVPFPFAFVDDESLIASNPKKYKKRSNDVKLMMENERTKIAVVRLLFDYFKLYKSEGLTEPPIMVAEKNKYFKKSAVVENWIEANLAPCDDMTKKLSVANELHSLFKATGEKITQKKFLADLKAVCGARPHKNERGVYSEQGYNFLAGWDWIEKEN